MSVNMTTRRILILAVMMALAVTTCARCIQSAPTADVGPETDPFGPRCGPDDGVGPGRHGGGAAEVWRTWGTVPRLLSSAVTARVCESF